MLADSKGDADSRARIPLTSAAPKAQTQKRPNRLAETRTASRGSRLRIRKPWVFFPPGSVDPPVVGSSLVAGRKQAPAPAAVSAFLAARARRPAGSGRPSHSRRVDGATTARDRVARRFPVSRRARARARARRRGVESPTSPASLSLIDRSSIGFALRSLGSRFGLRSRCRCFNLDVQCSVGPARERRECVGDDAGEIFHRARLHLHLHARACGPGVVCTAPCSRNSHRIVGSPRSSLHWLVAPWPW